jgi:NADPH-dependent 2,4-dienoyl-CoA reductase/sulfur reductase-like enzyme
VVDSPGHLIAKTPEALWEEQGVVVKVLHQVEEIDLKQTRIRLREQDNPDTWWEAFDMLMIATGALPIRPPVEGIAARGIFGINTLQSGLEVMAFIEERGPKHAVVIGGGYIGLEMAENLILQGMHVSLIERAPEVMGTLDPDMGALVSKALIDIGVKLYRKESLEGFEVSKKHVQSVVTDKRTLPADLVILGMGVKPNVSLAKEAGIKLGLSGAVQVDDTMRTSDDNVWAGGDCAESFHLISRRPVNIALGTVANKHGRVAGTNMGGGYAVFPGLVGTAVSKICSLEVARTGLQEKELQQTGREYVSAVIESTTRASYYPDAGAISVKILAEKGNGRLLGGQIVGKEGAAKRIDILATALHAGMTVEEIADLDLSYAPPYSPLWDPVAIGARIAMKKLTEHQ